MTQKAMALTSRCSGLAVIIILALLSQGEALFGRGKGGGGGGGAVVTGQNDGKKQTPVKLDPDRMQAAASQASERIMNWGTVMVFSLKAAAQIKGQMQRLQSIPGAVDSEGKPIWKIDPPLYKTIMGGTLGEVFLNLNSPRMGKVSEMARSLMKDQRRQARVLAMDQKVMATFEGSKGKPTSPPEGFLEGALLNKDVSAAHERFMADVEALSNSGLGKKVAASAEAYHHALLVYATDEGS